MMKTRMMKTRKINHTFGAAGRLVVGTLEA